ncbi:MAG: lysophospholipase [Micrococcales bacterium 70-64]|nr:alpha/beta hydrolase [Leifsonia sp.]ODU65387.1 MAG: lysophospholipase [Leifsonia sp. SCN 70-46]OJX87134.1 MAG: lysophospholipase [Micrococcales bacterium 70-64]
MATVTRTASTFVDAEGVTIHYYSWKAAKPKAVLQLTHGLGDHALRYEQVAQDLVAAGYTVYADDHRGHGATGVGQYGGDSSKMGRLGPGGLRATVEGVRQFTRIIREENPGLKLALLGHSWGSLMVQMILNEHADDYDVAVLTGTAYRTLTDMNGGNLNAKHKHLGTTGNEWLSRDPAVAQQFADDPLTFYAAAIQLFGIADGLRLLGKPTRNIAKDIPLLIMIGSEDTLGGEKSIAKLAEAYITRSRLSDVQAIVYPEARHEIFNETNRDEVIADLVSWLDARL